jgi:hypothetical protein
MLDAVAVLVLLAPSPKTKVIRAEVNITQKLLVPGCVDGTPIEAYRRRWRLELRPHTASFTLGSDARQAGFATVRFTLEAGHKYEIEVRTDDAMAFARRAFERGAWKPVVRDRTTDRIVSGEPEWSDSACPPQPSPSPAAQ